jgi:hypothetical protein
MLESATYEEVEADEGATWQAVGVVALASLAAGAGVIGGLSVQGTILRFAIALVSWATWAILVVQVGGRLLPEPQTRVNVPELLRTLGFAASPGLILALAGLPVIGNVVPGLAWLWMLLAMIVAVRQALDFERTPRAVLVCVVGGVVALGTMVGLSWLTATTLDSP